MELLAYTETDLADFSKSIPREASPELARFFLDVENLRAMAQDQAFNVFQGSSLYQNPSQAIDMGDEKSDANESMLTSMEHLVTSHKDNVPGDVIYQPTIKPEDQLSPIFTTQLPHEVQTIHKQADPYAPPYQAYEQDQSSVHASPMLLNLDQPKPTFQRPHHYEHPQYQYQHPPQTQYGSVPMVAQASQESQEVRAPKSLDERRIPSTGYTEQVAPVPYGHYPDITTMVNANTNIIAPMVETTFVDYKVCRICNKRITRDMSRHYRTHQLEKRFTCKFPKDACRHKSGQFNRPYDFKKHLLNKHFIFDDPAIKKVHNLRDKLESWGTCPCGRRFISLDWLDNHILTDREEDKCLEMEK